MDARIRAVGPRVVTLYLLLVGAMSSLPSASVAQSFDPRHLHAVRVEDAPVIDGRLDEAIWAAAEPIGGFLQRDPVEGEPASEDTIIRVAYDEDALYIAARLFDRQPSAIVRQLSRRDVVVEADALDVYLDPHHDHLTGAQFGVSAAGVQRDALIYNDLELRRRIAG